MKAETLPEPPVAPLLLNKKQVAKALGVSMRSVEIYANKKQLAFVRLGKRCIRYRPEDVAAFANRHVHPAVS